MIDRFKAWAADHCGTKPLGYDRDLPCYDFNRELVYPNTHPKHRDGCIFVRTDDDFFVVAALPWEFNEISIGDIVAVLWPHLTPSQISFYADTVWEKRKDGLK